MTLTAKATTRRRRCRLLSGAAIMFAGLGVLSGCAGSGSSPVQTQQAIRTPAHSSADVGGVSSRARQATTSGAPRDAVPVASPAQTHPGAPPKHAAGVERARLTPATTSDDTRAEKPAGLNPCRLVSVAEAQAIVGGPIAEQVEEPLGPTCVYRLREAPRQITLAIESLGFHQVTHEMSLPRPITIGQRRAYCGRLGTDMLFVPLRAGQVLNVTAPCPVAQRFAALALSRLAL